MVKINENERIDDLQFKGLKIIQNKDMFCFGVDAVLLSDFVSSNKNNSVLDLGTGTGIIPILLAGKEKASKIIGIEIQSDMVEVANRSITLNKLENQIEIIELDIKYAKEYFKSKMFDVVVSNPPYFKGGCGILNPNDPKAISRHEVKCNLEDVVSTASKLLNSGGEFAMIHRPDRLVDIICCMREYKIEPKCIRNVYPYENKDANLVLIKGKRDGKPELRTMPPLYVYESKGVYSKEIDRIYGRGEV